MASTLAATFTTKSFRISPASTQHRPLKASANHTQRFCWFSAPGKLSTRLSAKKVDVSRRNARRVVGVAVASGCAVNDPKHTIAEKFADLKAVGKVALISYITAGDPDMETTAQAMKILDRCGADIIELGVPYSDPLADGPVIQAATARALLKGTTLDMVLDMLSKVAPDIKAPIVLFTYYNPILKRGQENFLMAIKEAGASGLVVPDLPLEETENLRGLATAMGIELILLITPTTPQARMQAIAQAAQGFVYLVSLNGVTGARTSVQSKVQGLLVDLKQVTDKPVAVGFGISTPAQAAQVTEWGADGVIVGSAMVKILGESASPEVGLLHLEDFTRDLKAAIEWSEFRMEMDL